MNLNQLLEVADHLSNVLRLHHDALDHLTCNTDAIREEANSIRDQLADLVKPDAAKEVQS